jgi:hypothetical protein
MKLKEQIRRYCKQEGVKKTFIDYGWIGPDYIREALADKPKEILDPELIVKNQAVWA